MNEFRRITVALGRDEWERLRIAANEQYRHPRDQARYILRTVLIDGQQEEKHSGTAPNLTGTNGAAVSVAG